ncbi:glycosyl transferase [Aureococcus anophagefferens]|nr:glycosyl transferase [Aureococcus anophagefferens]
MRIAVALWFALCRAVTWDDGVRQCDGSSCAARDAIPTAVVRTSSGACASSAHLARAREAKRAKHEVHGALAWLVAAARADRDAGCRAAAETALAGELLALGQFANAARAARTAAALAPGGGARDAALAALAAAQDGLRRAGAGAAALAVALPVAGATYARSRAIDVEASTARLARPATRPCASAPTSTARRSWEWHVVGASRRAADAARPYAEDPIPASFHRGGLSVDGSSEYVDGLAASDARVVVHRPRKGGFWRDKVEMAAAALNAASPGPGALLLQLDVDELWTADALGAALRLLGDSDLTCAYFHCHFLVGPKLATATPRGYGHSDAYEWLRLWRADPDDVFWASHAPPRLALRTGAGWEPLAGARCLGHNATAAAGAVFTHHAYVAERQVAFKERYGYAGAPRFRATVADAVPFAAAAVLGVSTRAVAAAEAPPTPVVNAEVLRAVAAAKQRPAGDAPRAICVDGVVFQRQAGRGAGISRVWANLLPRLADAAAGGLVLLERGGSQLPASLAALHRRAAPPFPDDHDHVADALSLAWLCEGSAARVHGVHAPDGDSGPGASCCWSTT